MDLVAAIQDVITSPKFRFFAVLAFIYIYSNLKVVLIRPWAQAWTEFFVISFLGFEALVVPAVLGTLAHFGVRISYHIVPGLPTFVFILVSLFSFGRVFSNGESFQENTLRFSIYGAIGVAVFVAWISLIDVRKCEPVENLNMMAALLTVEEWNNMRKLLELSDANFGSLEWRCSY